MNNQFALKFCPQCEGSGKIESQYCGNVNRIAKIYGSDEFPTFPERAHSPSTCSVCNGFAVAKKGGYPYKSKNMAESMRRQGKAEKCFHCDSDGNTWIIPAIVKCTTCRGCGFVLEYDNKSTVVPDIIDIYGYQPLEFTEAWAKDVDIVVNRTGKSMSWGQAYLGIGSIWSSTDYGRHFEMTDDEVVASIRESLVSDRYQFIAICDKKTRTIARVVEVCLYPNGYSVVAVGKQNGDYALPPAYYDIIDKPVDVANKMLGVQ